MYKGAAIVSAKRSSRGVRTRRRPKSPARKSTSKLDQVRTKVREFILNRASIGDFYEALRSAIGKGELSPNPLNGVRFRRIVKEVVNERKRRAMKRS